MRNAKLQWQIGIWCVVYLVCYSHSFASSFSHLSLSHAVSNVHFTLAISFYHLFFYFLVSDWGIFCAHWKNRALNSISFILAFFFSRSFLILLLMCAVLEKCVYYKMTGILISTSLLRDKIVVTLLLHCTFFLFHFRQIKKK